jgi:hypothetical protein
MSIRRRRWKSGYCFPSVTAQMIQLVFESIDWLTEPYFFDIVFPLHFYLPKSLRHSFRRLLVTVIRTWLASHFRSKCELLGRIPTNLGELLLDFPELKRGDS